MDTNWIKNCLNTLDSNPIYKIIRIQFPIQLATRRTIHHAKNLTLDHLTFDLSGVTKHGLAYTTLFHIHSKEQLYLLPALSNNFFHVDSIVDQEMLHWKIITEYKLTIPNLESYWKEFIIIQSLNIHSLNLHFPDILVNQNLLASHILCLNETKIKNICTYQEIHNVILNNKFDILYCYNQHGTMIFYNKMVSLSNTTSIKDSNIEFIITTFNENTWKAIYVIAIYKPPHKQVSYFISILKPILKKTLTNCPIVIIGDFNIEMLTNTLQWMELKKIMNKYGLQLVSFETTTIYNILIDHIWINVLLQQCHFGSTKAYWTDHKPIHIAFKLLNHVPKFTVLNNTT